MKKLILICALLFAGSSFAQVLEQDSLALVAFYNSTGGPNWNNNANWLTGPVSSWYGVIVEGNRVVKLGYNFAFNNLNGYLPPEIGNLTALKILTPGNNPGLSGVIPDEIGNLKFMTGLGIGNCSLTGAIPNSIGNCSLLKFINLWENLLTGPIPPEIGLLDSLVSLELYDNQLTGSIPPELGNLKQLKELRLNNNQLTGNIPPSFIDFEQLETLYLQNNQLSGQLNEGLCSLFNDLDGGTVIDFSIANNGFYGPVPQSWGNKKIITGGLDISNNHFTSLPNTHVNNQFNWMITFFHIDNNKLTFEHLEPHFLAFQCGAYYIFQFIEQEELLLEKIDTALAIGSSFSIYSGTGGDSTVYKWYKNDELFLEGHGEDSLFLANISYNDTGTYYCHAVNTFVRHVEFEREPVHISIGNVGVSGQEAPKGLNIHPVPAGNTVFVAHPSTRNNSIAELKIYNILGELCLFEKVHQTTNNGIPIDISALKNGTYILKMESANYTQTAKFIKNRQGINR